jgi:hypothetical protein
VSEKCQPYAEVGAGGEHGDQALRGEFRDLLEVIPLTPTSMFGGRGVAMEHNEGFGVGGGVGGLSSYHHVIVTLQLRLLLLSLTLTPHRNTPQHFPRRVSYFYLA